MAVVRQEKKKTLIRLRDSSKSLAEMTRAILGSDLLLRSVSHHLIGSQYWSAREGDASRSISYLTVGMLLVGMPYKAP